MIISSGKGFQAGVWCDLRDKAFSFVFCMVFHFRHGNAEEEESNDKNEQIEAGFRSIVPLT